MAKSINKICQVCGNAFKGRRDAKTCSATCRKRLERNRSLKSRLLEEAKKVEQTVETDVELLAASLLSQQLEPALVTDDVEVEPLPDQATEESEEPSPPLGPTAIDIDDQNASEQVAVRSTMGAAPALLPHAGMVSMQPVSETTPEKTHRKVLNRFAAVLTMIILLLMGGIVFNLFIGGSNHTRISQLNINEQLHAQIELKRQQALASRTGRLEVKVNQLAAQIANLPVSGAPGPTSVSYVALNQAGTNNASTTSSPDDDTQLDAADITTGTLNDGRLSGNVALLDGINHFQPTTNNAAAFSLQNAGNTLTLINFDTTGGGLVSFGVPVSFSSTVTLGVLGATGSTPLCLNGSNQIGNCTGGGGGSGVTSLDTLIGDLTIANTTANSGTGTITINNASTSQKGIAQFNNTDFTVTNGNVDTIQPIAAASTPTFGGLTLSNLNSAGIVTNTAGGLLGTTTTLPTAVQNNITQVGALTSGSIGGSFGNINIGGNTFTGNGSGLTNLPAGSITGTINNNNLTNNGALTVTAGTGLTGGGPVALGGTTTLNVAYGNGANQAVQGNTVLNCATVSGNLTGGGGSITLGSGGSCNNIGLSATPSFTSTTLGIAGTTAGSLILNNSSNLHTTTLRGLASGTQDQVITIPVSTATADTFCLVTLANCSGSSGGSGNTNYIFNQTTQQASSNFNISGTGVIGSGLTVSSGGLAVTGNSTIAGTLGSLTGLSSSGTITFSGIGGAGLVQSSSGGALNSGAVDRNSGTFFSNALSVGNGGTGANTFALNGVLYGNGGGALQATTAGSGGQLLLANGSGVPTFTTVSGDVTISSSGVTTIGAGKVTNNDLANSSVTVSPGTNLNGGGNVALGGTITLNVADSPTFAGSVIVQGSNGISLGSTTNSGVVKFLDGTSDGFAATLGLSGTLSGNLNFSLPSSGGTLCTTSTCVAGSASAGGDLTGTYPNPTIAKLQGTTLTLSSLASGDILQYNGSAIVNHQISGDITVNGSGVATIGAGKVTNSDLVNNSVTITASTGLQGGGTVALGGTTSLNVAYGSTAGTSVQGNKTLTCASGTGNLSGGGDVITLGAGGTCSNVTMTSTPTFTSLTATGSNALTLGTTGSNTGAVLFKGATAASGTLTLIGPANPSTNTLTLPNETGTLCSTGSVCSGYAAATGSGSYIQNTTSQQPTSNFNISGTGVIGSGLTVSAGGANITGGLTSAGTTTLTGLSAGGVVQAAAGTGALSVAAVALGTQTTGNYVANIGTVTGLTVGSNSGAGSTPTLSVNYGSLANTAVQGNTTLACPSGTGNLNGGGNTITLGAGGTCNNIAITGSPSFAGTVTAGTGLTVSTGGITVTGNSTIAGTLGSLTGLTSSGTITFSGLSAGGVVQAAGGTGVLSVGAVALGTQTTGNYVSNIGTVTGLTLGGTSGAGSVPTLSVNYGSGSNTAVQGNTNLVCTSAGTGLSGGGNTVILGAAGNSCNSLSLATTGTGAAFVQGGNSFSALAVLGTNDSNNLALRTGGTNRVVLDTSGSLQFQQASTISTSTGNLTIQANGNSTLALDTTLAGTVTLGAVNATTINIGTGTTARAIGLGNSQTGTTVISTAGGTVATLSNSGQTIQTNTPSTTAFQVQNAGLAAVLAVDTTNTMVSTNGSIANIGGVNINGLAAPGNVDFNPITTGGIATYTYAVSAVNANGGATLAASSSPKTGNTNLVTNGNHITWTGVSGASSYKVYRTSVNGGSPSSVGLIATVLASTGITSFDDTGVSANTALTTPTVDTSGQLTATGTVLLQNAANSTTSLQLNNAAGTNLLTADTSNLTLNVGNANGVGFGSQNSYLVSGASSTTVATGDFNGDGLTDVAVSTGTANTVAIYINSGGVIPSSPTETLTGLTSATSLTTADFNGDGKMDLAVTNNNGATVFVNNYSGGLPFTAAAGSTPNYTLSGISIPAGITAGDFNNDGKPDLAIGQFGAGVSVYIYLNSAGTLNGTPSETISGFNAPFYLANGDINGDGKTDLVVSNFGGNNAFVLGNTGSTSVPFDTSNTGSHSYTLSGLGQPDQPVLADFNGDGRLDLAVANSSSNTVSIFINNGGTLPGTASYTLTGLNTPQGLVAADFNGDGKMDLAASNVGGTNPIKALSVFMNTGNTLSITANYLLSTGSGSVNATLPMVADLNNDGKIDIISAMSASTFSVYYNNSSPGTATKLAVKADADGVGETIQVGSNSSADALQVSNETGTVYRVDNSGGVHIGSTTAPGNSGFSSRSDLPTGSNPSDVVRGDFNGDGLLDMAVANGGGTTVSVYINTGSGVTSLSESVSTSPSAPTGVAVGDINGDGLNDLIISTSTAISVFLSSGGSTPYSTTTASYNLTSSSGLINPLIADFNGDGKPDLAALNNSSNSMSVYLNSGTTLQSVSPQTVTVSSSPQGLAAADFNGDGKLDLAVGTSAGFGGSIKTFYNSGGGTPFSGSPSQTLPDGSNPLSLLTGDFNGDGKPDLVAANNNSNTVSVFTNGGTALPTSATYTLTNVTSPRGLTSADFNGDGKLDLAVGTSSGSTISVFLNTGIALPATTNNTLTTGSANPRALTSGDFNGDGKTDLATANNSASGSAGASVFYNLNAPSRLSVSTTTSTNVGAVIQGVSNQSADLMEIQSSTGAILAAFNSNGALQGGNGSGNNGAGSNLTLAGGSGTGTGNGGSILLQIAKPSGSSSLTNNGFTTVATFSGTNGSLALQNATDSNTAFQVQKSSGAGGGTVLDVDTTNGRVGINTSSPGAYSLDVSGSINTSSGLYVNGTSICSLSGCTVSSGSATSWIQNNVFEQANFNIQSASQGTVGATILGASSSPGNPGSYTQTADLLDLGTTTGTVNTIVAKFDNNGNFTENGVATFQATGNSSTAVRILQQTSGIALFTANTSNLSITVSGNSSNYAELVLNDAHFKVTQDSGSEPTFVAGSQSNCGTSPSTPTFTAGSTDTAGSFTVFTGASTATANCTAQFKFHTTFNSIPKTIIISPATNSAVGTGSITQSATTTSNFTWLAGSTPGNNKTLTYYYWVIE